MKVFIINSFRMIVYIAYFAIIIVQSIGAYIRRSDVNEVFVQLTGSRLNDAGEAALAIFWGLLTGWLAATIVCGLLVTLLDIRDDINDRLPDGRVK
jgi:choline-glycine betaine transporter